MAGTKKVETKAAMGCGPKIDRNCCSTNSECYLESKYVNGKIIYTGRCCQG
ncbi:MAG: hypothetical protein ACI32W_09995 [Enterococcus faecalis]